MSAENYALKYITNPGTGFLSTDLMYVARSPYGLTNDIIVPFSGLLSTLSNSFLPISGANLSTATSLPLTTGVTGILPVANGGTNLSTYTINGILFASSASVLGQVGVVDSAVMITSASGVPSFSTSLPSFTMSGTLNMGSQVLTALTTPVNPTDAVTKAYADTIAAGFNPIAGVYAASTANLTGWIYANGTAGVGAELTAPSNGVFTVDGVSPPVGARFLYKNDTTYAGVANGIYTVMTSTAGSPAVLTRATDYNTPGEINSGDLVAVENGTANSFSSWYETATVVTIGVSAIAFSVFFSPANFLAVGNNLSDLNNATTARNNLGLGTANNVQFATMGLGIASIPALPGSLQQSDGTVIMQITPDVSNLRGFMGVTSAHHLDLGANSIPAIRIDTSGNVTIITAPLPVGSGGTGVIASKSIIQYSKTIVSTVSTGTTVLPFDNTIPQNTEGVQFMSLAIIPKSATNLLKIEVVCNVGSSVTNNMTVSLIQDSTANALAAVGTLNSTGGQTTPVNFTYWMIAGTVISTTFAIRAGGASAGTTTFNGTGGTQLYGGVMASSITITEFAP